MESQLWAFLGIEGSTFIDQLTADVTGGRGGDSMARKGVLKELLFAHFAPCMKTKRSKLFVPKLRGKDEDSRKAT